MTPFWFWMKNPCIFMKKYWKVIRINIQAKLIGPDRLVAFRIPLKHSFPDIQRKIMIFGWILKIPRSGIFYEKKPRWS